MASVSIYLHHLITSALILSAICLSQHETQFIYNGFKAQNNTHDLLLEGLATILPNGLLQLTNFSDFNTSHAFYPYPMVFKKSHLSFSTTFVFAMYPQMMHFSGHGIAFVVSPTTDFKEAIPPECLGLFNYSTNDLSSNHIFAVELDTVQSIQFGDINSNHVGIDVNGLNSVDVASTAYYSDKDRAYEPLLLNSGKAMQIWIDYNEFDMLLTVTLAPFRHPKPSKCLLSKHINLSAVLLESMYIGFSSSTGKLANSHYIIGWSWNQNGKAKELNFSELPSLPQFKSQKLNLKQKIFVLLLIAVLLLLLMIAVVTWYVWRKKYEELNEPWEEEYSAHRISYKDLYKATKGFRNSEILGVGGFGKVYKGILPSTNAQVAVKRLSHGTQQGMKEFVAEISTMTKISHRNLVQLLGYCRRQGELLLIYDYMPNGSLDQFLYGCIDDKSNLSWSSRFKILKGVASALLYLHEEWEQVVLHRDVKASNVLLDDDLNARLGDFGLARLYDHSIDPRTTNVVGTIGYIAPELSRTRKPTTSTDVYAFGMFLLEVVCGRRPLGKQDNDDEDEVFFLSDWVYECWKRGEILEASDPKMEGGNKEEKELVLKLGLLCLNPRSVARPKMRHVVQFLNGSADFPDIPSEYNPDIYSSFLQVWTNLGFLPSSSSSSARTVSPSFISSTNSVLYYGR